MTLARKMVGPGEEYRGHQVAALYVGPDLVATVNGQELPNFFLNAEAARNGVHRYVDNLIKEQEKRR